MRGGWDRHFFVDKLMERVVHEYNYSARSAPEAVKENMATVITAETTYHECDICD